MLRFAPCPYTRAAYASFCYFAINHSIAVWETCTVGLTLAAMCPTCRFSGFCDLQIVSHVYDR